MLDQHADEALEGTENRAVQHDRALTVVIFGDIAGIQALWQVRIVLQGAALPVTTEAVLQGELDLRAIESTLPRLVFPGQTGLVQRISQSTFSAIPQLVGTHTLCRTSGQLHGNVREAEVLVDLKGQLDEIGRLLLYLIFGAEDVGVVLGETTHAHDAVQRAGRLVTVTGTEFGQTQRQVTIGLQALVEDLHVARAVHRLDRVVATFRRSGEHVFRVVGPVPRTLPEDSVDHLRGAHFHITVIALHLAHVLLQHLIDSPASRMPEHHARRLFLQMEQIQLLADAAVVTLFSFFNALDIGRQLLLVGPGSAIDTLQLLVLRVAAPVGTGNLGQFEGFQEAGVRHVRAATHVHVLLVEVQAHGRFVRHVVDQAQLVFLTASLEQLDNLGTRSHLLDDVVVLVDQLSHALFDRRHIFRSEGALEGDVVVEALLDHRTDHHPGSRIELLDGVANQVRAGVADDLQPLLVLRRDDLQGSVGFDQIAGIHLLAVDLASQSCLGQARTDGLGHLEHGNGIIESTLTAVRKSDDGHGASSPSGDLYQRPHGLG
ncbi:hypothetical protein D9M70_422090 [compost metagenome]